MKLVLLPGMDGTGTLFAPFIAALGPNRDTLVVSYPTGAALGYAELTLIARAALPASGPFVILGESFSGPIAIALASSARAAGLVLGSSFVRNPRPLLGRLGVSAMRLPFGPTAVRPLSRLLLGRFATAALKRMLSDALTPVSRAAIHARMRAIIHIDASEHLRDVRVPVLYLRATADRLVPPRAFAQISSLCPQVREVTIDAPHCLLQVRPAESARVVGDFLGELEQRRK